MSIMKDKTVDDLLSIPTDEQLIEQIKKGQISVLFDAIIDKKNNILIYYNTEYKYDYYDLSDLEDEIYEAVNKKIRENVGEGVQYELNFADRLLDTLFSRTLYKYDIILN